MAVRVCICLLASPGFEARDNPKAKGAGQLLVTTPAGRSSVYLTFFKSPEDAQRWSGARA